VSDSTRWIVWTERLERWRRRSPVAYAIAAGCVVVATAARLAIDPMVHDRVPFITFFPAVLLASLVAGFGPGLVAIALSGMAAWYFFLPPTFSFAFASADLSLLLLFLAAAVLMVGFVAVIDALVERLLLQHRTLLAARQREVDRQELLVRELEHRTRNIFGLVETLAAQSFKSAASPMAGHDAFLGRLAALAAAYKLDAAGGELTLLAVLQQLLQLHGGRIHIQGCEVTLTDKALRQLTLIVHELHTNAMKHGALSRPSGRVAISGNVEGDGAHPTFRFVWQEFAGPVVTRPSRTGFGQMILSRAPASEGALVSIDYDPGGLRYSYTNVLAAITPEPRLVVDRSTSAARSSRPARP
jgi:two-component sensor histidine kinase